MRPVSLPSSVHFQKSITSVDSPSHSASAPPLPLASDEHPIARRKKAQAARKDGGGREASREAALLFDIAAAKGTGRSVSKRVIELEMAWLNDPAKLADRVSALLKKGDAYLAATLIRQAQNDGLECIVAWNTLFKYCFEREAPLAAFKFYNDVGNCPTHTNPIFPWLTTS